MEERGVGHELFSEKANPSSQEWIEFLSEKIKAEQNAFFRSFSQTESPCRHSGGSGKIRRRRSLLCIQTM
ncbi:hypothetical protein LEP1GSC029_4760 [Leptospira interrogans str. 2002000626]|uniref:Uncharacterized protein n=1 Tax=Leptospira interrogans str. 2002000626 TaxID=996803 RepID=A0A829D1Y2_LEPIR|nr:hypothetical protein LEP1GSC029_4760 [Leptospira interrogans str. 2002000626]